MLCILLGGSLGALLVQCDLAPCSSRAGSASCWCFDGSLGALLVQFVLVWCLAAPIHVLHLAGACATLSESCLFSFMVQCNCRACLASCWSAPWQPNLFSVTESCSAHARLAYPGCSRSSLRAFVVLCILLVLVQLPRSLVCSHLWHGAALTQVLHLAGWLPRSFACSV